MDDSFLKEFKEKGEVYLRVKVAPGASKTEVRSLMDDLTIKIDVRAIAEKGKANEALIKFLAKEFGVDKNDVKIISGAGVRIKLIKIKS